MKRQRGFTLVEAAIAIGVVAILSGIIVPLVINSVRDARLARARNDINIIAGAIANQLKDMGSRPIVGAAAGLATPGLSTGAGNAIWQSSGASPNVLAGGVWGDIPNLAPQNSFENLFMAPSAQSVPPTTENQANRLFGLGPIRPTDEFRYKGPYLTDEVVHKTDPWGRCYVILGYNENGQTNNGPIWVVSAGPGRRIEAANLAVAGGRYRAIWDYNGESQSNIAVRVH